MTVVAPEGWTVASADDSQAWYLNGNQAFLQINVNSPQKLQLEVTPG